MADVLWITLVGMGLVFVAILLLWGLMALIVRLTAEREMPAAEGDSAETPLLVEAAAVEAEPRDLRRRAAAAAVAAALAMKAGQPARRAAGQTVSAWQAVQRAGELSRRVNAPRRKRNG